MIGAPRSSADREGIVAALLRRYRTYRSFRASQLAGRAVAELRRSLGLVRVPAAPAGLSGSLDLAVEPLRHDPWNSAAALAENRVTFLNVSRQMGHPWDWRAKDMSLLWRFHLHYFGYLHLLDREDRIRLCLEWVEHSPVGKGEGWHPYPTSLRISNWCALLGEWCPSELQESLYRQAGHLARDLETYLSGNHLIENAKALVLAGLYFGGAGESERWLVRGLELLREELSSQILPDGGHYERSPMYHAQVLTGCLDLLNALPPAHDHRGLLRDVVGCMLRFLHGTTHPDGTPGLFGDSTLDGAPAPGRIAVHAAELEAATPSEAEGPLAAFPDSGYYRFRAGPFWLLLDAGPIGPSDQPAHGHADIFSYELSLRGHRWITDTGVESYESGGMRSYSRSTRAHNTLDVDGTDQAEMWGTFRVARRFAPDVEEARVDRGTFRFSGRFEGYRELVGDGIVHRRTVACDPDEGRLRVEDRLEGRGRHVLATRLHLHPDVELLETGSRSARTACAGSGARLQSSHDVTIESGWYCPRFGVRRPRPVLCVGGELKLPVTLAYEFTVE